MYISLSVIYACNCINCRPCPPQSPMPHPPQRTNVDELVLSVNGRRLMHRRDGWEQDCNNIRIHNKNTMPVGGSRSPPPLATDRMPPLE